MEDNRLWQEVEVEEVYTDDLIFDEEDINPADEECPDCGEPLDRQCYGVIRCSVCEPCQSCGS